MAVRLVNQSDAAKIYACTPQSIRTALSPGRPLYGALRIDPVTKMKWVDMNDPAAKAYRQAERVDPDAPVPEPEAAKLPAKIRECYEMTLRQVFEQHGSMAIFKDLLLSIKIVEDIHAKRLDADKRTGELIERAFVKQHVLGLVDRIHRRMLAELPVGLSYVVHGKCSTGGTVEEIQQLIKDAVSRELKTVKKDTRNAIRKAT